MRLSAFRSKIDSHKRMALDGLRNNVMLADADLRITFMNKSLVKLLGEAEGDLKKELPRFDMATLVGSNIDIFHKNPSHQRNLLAALQKPHSATIRVGSRAFDLFVSPLREGGKTVGFSVEWADAKERLLNLDYTGQIEAIHRSQAVIEFAVDGTVLAANQNFLTVLGYELGEILGQNHSMFVDADYRQSQDYAQFWEELRAGRFQASEFKRIGKNGREAWIQGSYNPILDHKGQVTKVVKFATDVTARVNAVARLGSGLSAMSQGQLDRRIETPLPPELDQLRIDYNQAQETLSSTIQRVQQASVQISEGMNEISAAAGDLSQRTEQQAASLEETVAALSEVMRGVDGTASEAGRAQNTAATALRNAEKGGHIVAEAIDAMNGIEQSSDKIGKIIGVIDEIAFQTNLLALNAGVEAARAGEAGRGFAVVAQEVRGLAQRSAEAAREIKDLISTSTAQVEHGVGLVSASGRSTQEIVSQVSEMNRVVGLISEAAREQAVSLKEVATAADQMDKMTQQNAAMVEETTAATRNLLSETAKLSELMSQFETGGVSASPSAARSRSIRREASANPVVQLKSTGRGGAAPATEASQESWTEF